MIDKYLIVGQGLAGSLIAYELLSRNLEFTIVDAPQLSRASKVAAGIINPLTGRKFVKTWMYEDLEKVFTDTYEKLEKLLGGKYLHRKEILRAIPTIKDQNNWDARGLQDEAAKYMSSVDPDFVVDPALIEKQAYGSVSAFQLHISKLVSDLRHYLLEDDKIIEEIFQHSALVPTDNHIEYKGLQYKGAIFCEGHKVSENPYFNDLPFSPAKGELLIVRISNLKINYILKDHLFLAPIKDDLYWLGASYEWKEFSDLPTEEKRDWLIQGLEKIVSTSYEIIDHQAGVRPASKFRKPLMGAHRDHSNIFLFNGLGTKGASLGPFWAKHFVDCLLSGSQVSIDVRI